MPDCGRRRKTKTRFPAAAHEPLEIAPRFPHSLSPDDYYRMEKWKSKSRIPTFPRSFFLFKIKNRKEPQSSLLSSFFRLISGLENAKAAFYGVGCAAVESLAPGVMMTSPVDLRATSYTRSGSKRM